MSRLWTGVASAALLVLALVACSGPGNKDDATPVPSANSAASIDGVEVKSTPCWQPADDASTKSVATASGLRGVISVRKSLAAGAQCDKYYWARFQPDPNSTSAFTVTFKKGDTEAPVQGSEPKQPTWAAFTVGYHGKVGEHLVACVVPPGGTAICADTTVA